MDAENYDCNRSDHIMNFTEIRNNYVWGPAVEANSHSQNRDDLLAGISIDAWRTGIDDEQGVVVAHVLLTQRGDFVVDYLDNEVRVIEPVKEHIAAARRDLKEIWAEHIQKLWASNRHVIKLGYSATLVIPKLVADQINGFLKANCEDEYQGVNSTIIYTVLFLDGRQMDIKCCGCQSESSWTEAVLFDVNGNQLCCTEPAEEFFGTRTLKHDGIDYTVQVVEEEMTCGS